MKVAMVKVLAVCVLLVLGAGGGVILISALRAATPAENPPRPFAPSARPRQIKSIREGFPDTAKQA